MSKMTIFYFIGIGALSALPTVWAMPDLRSNRSGLGDFQTWAQKKYSNLEGVSFYEDHSEKKVLYVSPSNRKIQAGGYSPIRSNQCSLLRDQYRVTFNYPTHLPNEQWADLAKRGPFSPAFDVQFGLSIYYQNALAKIATHLTEIEQLRKDQASLYGPYVASKDFWDETKNKLNEAQAAPESYDKRILDLFDRLKIVETNEERQDIRAQIALLREEKVSRLPELQLAIKEASAQELQARIQFREASAAWSPYQVKEDDLTQRALSIKTIYDASIEMATAAFISGQTLLENFEGRIVGVATTGYNVWGTEVADANAALNDYSSRSGRRIVPLPLFNIRATTNEIEHTLARTDGSGTGLAGGSITSKEVQSGIELNSSEKVPHANPIFTAESGAPVTPLVAHSEEGAGLVSVPVTMGAYCTGSSERHTKSIPLMSSQNRTVDFQMIQYQERKSPEFQQAVAINYEFYAKAEPVGVTCSLKVENFSKYMRNAGTKGFLFWRESWDDTQRSSNRKNGLDCRVTEAPTFQDSEEQKKRLDALEQTMAQEVTAEFILNFAKSYKIIAEKTTLPKNHERNAFRHLGLSMNALCGLNAYCSVGSVVLKSMDELFGSSAGSTSNRETFKGTISRSYSRDSFRVAKGSAVVDLRVQLPVNSQ